MNVSKQTCTRRIQFCCGHRVKNHESKCAHLHGHNYVIEIEADADALDSIGRVIDFSVLKAKIGGWIETHWDHGFVLWNNDDEAIGAMREFGLRMGGSFMQKLFLMPYNPTAENMAKFLLEVICPEQLAGTGVRVVSVVVHETENCKATARL